MPGEFPADADRGDDGIFAFHVDADADDILKVGTVNVGAADEKRHTEVIRSEIGRPIKARLRLEPDQDRIRKLRIQAKDQGAGLEGIGQRCLRRQSEGKALPLQSEAKHSEFDARGQNELQDGVTLIVILDRLASAFDRGLPHVGFLDDVLAGGREDVFEPGVIG